MTLLSEIWRKDDVFSETESDKSRFDAEVIAMSAIVCV